MSTETSNRLLLEKVLQLEKRGGRTLNFPSGFGRMTEMMEEAGIDVTAADLFPEISVWKPEEVVRADMNETLPFRDDSFDTIVCQEGIEHIEDVASFIRECSRILREGGTLLVTTPNYMDLSSRLSYLLIGVKSFHGDFPNEEATLWGHSDGRHYHGHAFTIPFFQIRYLMRICQFDDIELNSLGDSSTSRWLSWVLRPFMGPMLRFTLWRRRRRESRRNLGRTTSDQLAAELRRFALSRELLRAKRICVSARLRDGSFKPKQKVMGA